MKDGKLVERKKNKSNIQIRKVTHRSTKATCGLDKHCVDTSQKLWKFHPTDFNSEGENFLSYHHVHSNATRILQSADQLTQPHSSVTGLLPKIEVENVKSIISALENINTQAYKMDVGYLVN